MRITAGLTIPDEELSWSFARSGGPGGQNVNKSNTRAVLHWNLAANTTLPAGVRERLRALSRNRLTTNGELVIQSQTHRSQERNRQACLDKLCQLVRQAATPPRLRQATQPTHRSQHRRLQAKRRHSHRKEQRRQSFDP